MQRTAPTRPNGRDWTQVISTSSDGGVVMGNPAAAVHLIEIGSLTCPHCREFEQKGVPPLIDDYVKTGKVSYEFRNYIRDTFDMAAVLIAKCNGPKDFFAISTALYADQPRWEAKIDAIPGKQFDSLEDLPQNEVALRAAKMSGLQDWAAAHGVTQARSAECLTDTGAIGHAVSSSGAVTQQWPEFEGTPSFVINGRLDNDIGDWNDLDAALKSALGR